MLLMLLGFHPTSELGRRYGKAQRNVHCLDVHRISTPHVNVMCACIRWQSDEKTKPLAIDR
jgi:hypothetical protein